MIGQIDTLGSYKELYPKISFIVTHVPCSLTLLFFLTSGNSEMMNTKTKEGHRYLLF